LFIPSFPSGLDGLNLMGCLMGPKSFLEGLWEPIAIPWSNYCVVIYDFLFLRYNIIFNGNRVILLLFEYSVKSSCDWRI
jgi:hypothetical protein